jgi:chloramphenicol 3-O-phosphotransferase
MIEIGCYQDYSTHTILEVQVIIVISGTSSSGKSSVCSALFEKLGEPWLHFSTDGYLGMLGPKFEGLHPSNASVCEPNEICYAQKYEDGTYEIIPGKFCSKLFSTIPDAVALLAAQGFNIILDSFLTVKDDLEYYKKVLSKYDPHFFYLYADANIINQREAQRGDRLNGSAVNWLKAMDHQSGCDLSLDSGILSPEEICDSVIKHCYRLI